MKSVNKNMAVQA